MDAGEVVLAYVDTVLSAVSVVTTELTFYDNKHGNISIPSSYNIPDVLHCTAEGFSVHWPVLLQVLVMGSERNSPSSHWKVTVAPSVVLDTALTTPLEGNSGWPQSTSKPIMENHNKFWPRSCTLLTCAVMECWIR